MIEGEVRRSRKTATGIKGKTESERLMDGATERGKTRGRGQVSDRVRDRVRTRGNESERQRQKKRERERGEKGRAKERVSFISAFKSPLGSVRRLG